MLTVNNELKNGVLALRVTGKLTESDLNDLVPVLKIRLTGRRIPI